ncbi:MAG: hypothetical protein ACKVQA_11240 [Burkholderiales bacterium]
MAAKKSTKRASGGNVVTLPLKNKRPPRIQFVYKFPETYNPVYSNGAYGGISPQGDFVIHFYHERHPLPYSTVNEITSEGAIGKELERDPKSDDPIVLRYVTTGVAMDMSAAKRLFDWLGKNLALAQERGILGQSKQPPKSPKK